MDSGRISFGFFGFFGSFGFFGVRMIACVTGPDGSGKSTQVAAVAGWLRKEGHSVAISQIWDPMLDPAFAGRALFDSPAKADAYLELLDSTSRMYFLCHALQESLVRARARETDVVLLNAYWYKYHAVEVAHGGDAPTLRTINSVLPEPDVTFYLRIPPALADLGRHDVAPRVAHPALHDDPAVGRTR